MRSSGCVETRVDIFFFLLLIGDERFGRAGLAENEIFRAIYMELY